MREEKGVKVVKNSGEDISREVILGERELVSVGVRGVHVEGVGTEGLGGGGEGGRQVV